ncbi:MAG: hypothetical protein ABJ308_18575 [Halieaceae bacterium]
MQAAELIFQLLVVHAILDFMLQPNVMASAKSRTSKLHEKGNSEFPAWYYWLGAHSLGHGGGVYLVTGNLWLGLVEVVLHGGIDYLKCEHKTNLAQDQSLHLLCKLGYCWYLL